MDSRLRGNDEGCGYRIEIETELFDFYFETTTIVPIVILRVAKRSRRIQTLHGFRDGARNDGLLQSDKKAPRKPSFSRKRESTNVTPCAAEWIPACAGMTMAVVIALK